VKQIPCGDDRKKSKGKDSDAYNIVAAAGIAKMLRW
jgi:hypothetical protein